jgi:hypothetical protein
MIKDIKLKVKTRKSLIGLNRDSTELAMALLMLTIEMISDWTPILDKRNIKLIPVSDIFKGI